MKKACKQCGVEHRLMDYYRHPYTADGFQPVCKACHRSNVKANRARNVEHYREADKARANLPHRVEARKKYASTPEGRAAIARARKAYKERNPLKRAAQVMAGNAIRDGRLTRKACEVCGNTKTQAHHDDYGKPLDVRWLCVTHHSEWHKHNKPICPDKEQAA